MATEQTKITFYLPKIEDDKFRAAVKDEQRTITAVLRRLIQKYLAESTNGGQQ